MTPSDIHSEHQLPDMPDRPTGSGKIRIGLVEDQFLFREGIKAILSSWGQMEVVFESGDGHSVIQRLRESKVRPDVMLIDMSLPPDGKREYSGLDLTQAMKEEFPDIRIIILSVYDDDHFMVKIIRQGAHGYLVKDSNPKEVHEAIIAVHTKGTYINARTLLAIQNDLHKKNVARPIGNITNDIVLTRREEEILLLICKQKTTEEIAAELFISPKTVNGHRNNLLQKTGSRNVAGLVAFALSRQQSGL